MTRDQIRLVQASFRNVLPIREQAAALFYDRLFEIDPGTRRLFADTDLRSQGGKLMAAIGMVVHALDAPELMVEKLKELARRHVNYGGENRHYATVGAALLWTLQVGGRSFTPELRDAWASAYNMLSERMMEAATGAASTHATTEFPWATGRGPSRDAWVRQKQNGPSGLLDGKACRKALASLATLPDWQCARARSNFRDPIEGRSYGTTTARVMSARPGGAPVTFSYAHGRMIYALKHDVARG